MAVEVTPPGGSREELDDDRLRGLLRLAVAALFLVAGVILLVDHAVTTALEEHVAERHDDKAKAEAASGEA